MSERGVFAMDRGWFGHEAFASEPYTEREAWAWLIAEASYRARKRRIGKCIVSLERGQLATAIRFLAEKWSWTASKVQRYMAKLRVHEMIATDAIHGITVVTICNYNKYQRVSLPPDTQTDTLPIQQRYKVESQETKEEEDGGERERATSPKPEPLIQPEAHEIADELSVIAGHDPKHPPPQWYGAVMHVSKWLREGWSREIILTGARGAMARKRDGPPDSAVYFEKPIARLLAQQAAPLPKIKIAEAQEITIGGGNGQDRNGNGNGFTAHGGRRSLASIAVESARVASETRR